MATTQTLTPAVGAAPSFTQTGTGATPGYSAVDFRRMASYGPIQEGVVEAGAFMVTQRAAGANMSVDVAASTGSAYVQGDSITLQGLYYVPPHTAVVNLDVAASDATNPRVDSVYLEIKDDTHDAGGLNLTRLRYITGTATGGATLDNRTGAPANPGSGVLLADVWVEATVTTVPNTKIRDRRPWARGAQWTAEIAAGDYTRGVNTYASIDATNINRRIECSGVPVVIKLVGSMSHSAVGGRTDFTAAIDGSTIGNHLQGWTCPGANYLQPLTLEATSVPSAGSHLFSWLWKSSAATATLYASAGFGLRYSVTEVVQQNKFNNDGTSG